MLTEQLLDRLSATWRAHGVPVEEALAPGRDVVSFGSDDGRLHVALATEIRTWWDWHDGYNQGWDGKWIIGPGLQHMSSARSRTHWQKMLTMAVEAAERGPEGTALADPDYWWRASWIPLASDGSGYIVADCDLGGPDEAAIRRIEWGPDLDIIARPRTESFGQLVEWWIEAIELGLWSYDSDTGKWTAAPWDRALEARYQGLI